jgi:hypothetical protein
MRGGTKRAAYVTLCACVRVKRVGFLAGRGLQTGGGRYESYGFSEDDIGRLFIAGFGSSLVFGTVLGAFADHHGRRSSCMMCAFHFLSLGEQSCPFVL